LIRAEWVQSHLDLFEVVYFILALLVLIPLLGHFLANLFQDKRTFLHPVFGWLEKLTYRITGIDPLEEMRWKRYAKVMLLFNCCGIFAVFFILILQTYLPFNPQHFDNVPWLLALNTAISFTTNTNWQAYAGETTLSYASQMWALTVQNFLSAATGLAVLMALIRGILRKTTDKIGNFWSDFVRSIVYLLLPLSIICALVLVTQGVVQTLSPYTEVETLEGAKQTIAVGPVASQVAIKQLGTNGGGFFNTNSAHPFENPNALSNFFEALMLVLIPAASVYAYGVTISSKRHGWMLLGVMFFLWIVGVSLSSYSMHTENPVLKAFPVLEGKETRIGNTASLLWATLTTGTSNGSVNAMHDSLSPLTGGVLLFNMMLGEVIFGGVGVGLCSMLLHVLLAVFLSGLMVGRTPEYMGKKIEKLDIQWVILAVLAPSALILIGAGISIVSPLALSSISNAGPHGLTQILYAFTSAAMNNGSAFAGLDVNTNYFNAFLGVVMLLGRVAILVPSLGIAGNLATKKIAPPSAGTLSTNSFLFAILLMGVITIVGALTFMPALSLGPVAEHLLMLRGQAFPLQ